MSSLYAPTSIDERIERRIRWLLWRNLIERPEPTPTTDPACSTSLFRSQSLRDERGAVRVSNTRRNGAPSTSYLVLRSSTGATAVDIQRALAPAFSLGHFCSTEQCTDVWPEADRSLGSQRRHAEARLRRNKRCSIAKHLPVDISPTADVGRQLRSGWMTQSDAHSTIGYSPKL